jgi:hypothetical protein
MAKPPFPPPKGKEEKGKKPVFVPGQKPKFKDGGKVGKRGC